MNIRPLESLTKEELIELIKQERGDHNGDDNTSDSVLNAKYTDGYISGYVVACNFAASLASEAWVNHVFRTGLDGLIERCKNMEQVLLEKAQACHGSWSQLRTFLPVGINHETEGWKLVPVEPTEAMHIAARDWSTGKYGKAIGTDASEGCYKAMLAATPQPDHFPGGRNMVPVVKESLTNREALSDLSLNLIREGSHAM